MRRHRSRGPVGRALSLSVAVAMALGMCPSAGIAEEVLLMEPDGAEVAVVDQVEEEGEIALVELESADEAGSAEIELEPEDAVESAAVAEAGSVEEAPASETEEQALAEGETEHDTTLAVQAAGEDINYYTYSYSGHKPKPIENTAKSGEYKLVTGSSKELSVNK